MNILQQLDQEQIAKLGRDVPDFQPGDTLIVNVKVKEGERARVQAYEGVCIARAGAAPRPSASRGSGDRTSASPLRRPPRSPEARANRGFPGRQARRAPV